MRSPACQPVISSQPPPPLPPPPPPSIAASAKTTGGRCRNTSTRPSTRTTPPWREPPGGSSNNNNRRRRHPHPPPDRPIWFSWSRSPLVFLPRRRCYVQEARTVIPPTRTRPRPATVVARKVVLGLVVLLVRGLARHHDVVATSTSGADGLRVGEHEDDDVVDRPSRAATRDNACT